MNIIIVLICIIGILWFYNKSKKPYHPAVLYLSVWAALFFIYNLGWYPLPSISETTYWIVTIGILSFVIGCAITGGVHKLPEVHDIRIPRKGLIRTFSIIFFVLLSIPFLKALKYLLAGVDLHDIRYVYHDEIVGQGLLAIAFVYFCEPFLVFYEIYAVADLYSKSRNWINTVLPILGVVMITVTTGGRFFIMYYLFSLIVAMLMNRGSIVNKQIKKYAILFVTASMAGIVAVSLYRGSDIGRTFYVYLSASIPFLDHLLEEWGNMPPMFGAFSLNGFLRPIFVVFRMFGGIELPVFMQLIETIQLQADEGYAIMPGELYNSFYTIFYSLYLDGGLFGVALGNFVLAVISMLSFRKLQESDTFSAIVYLIFANMLLLAFFRLLIISYSYALAFIYLFICYSKKSKTYV